MSEWFIRYAWNPYPHGWYQDLLPTNWIAAYQWDKTILRSRRTNIYATDKKSLGEYPNQNLSDVRNAIPNTGLYITVKNTCIYK